MRFMDTMAIHISLAGFTNMQRAIYSGYRSGKSAKQIRDMKKKSQPRKRVNAEVEKTDVREYLLTPSHCMVIIL